MQVTDNAREVWDKDESKSALRKRVSFVGGNFFKKGACLVEAIACGCQRSLAMHAREPEHERHVGHCCTARRLRRKVTGMQRRDAAAASTGGLWAMGGM